MKYITSDNRGSKDGHRGDGGGTLIMNFELTRINKIFKWYLVGVTLIKISNWGDKIIKIVKQFAKIP